MELLSNSSSRLELSNSAYAPLLSRKAENRLRGSSYLALRDVSCIADDGVITLHGILPSYYLKQLAQETANGVEGVRRVINHIKVLAPAGRMHAN